MKIKKVIVHIGVEKTGSTSIQRAFSANKENLAKANCYYPASLGPSNHTKLAIYAGRYELGFAKRFLNIGTELEFAEWRTQLKSELLDELAVCDSELLVLSCEWLAHSLIEDAEFDRLKKLLSTIATDVSILFYIRRQDELAVSRFSTALKGGSTNEFKFPESALAHAGLFDFHHLYEKWCSHFSDVQVRLFDRKYLYKNDLIADTFEFCGLDSDAICTSNTITKENLSLSEEGQALMLAFNKMVEETDSTPSNSITARKVRRILGEAMPGKFLPCGKQEAKAFAQLFEESNEKLRQKVFPQLEQLFSTNFDKYQ